MRRECAPPLGGGVAESGTAVDLAQISLRQRVKRREPANSEVLPVGIEPRQVAFVVELLADAGGVEQSLVTLSEELVRRGCHVWLYSCQRVRRDNQYARALRKLGVDIASPPRTVAGIANVPAEVRDRLVSWALALLAPALGAVSLVDAVIRRRSVHRSLAGVRGRARELLARAIPYDRLRYRWLVRRVRRLRPDVLHVHGYGGGLVPEGGIEAARRSETPIVYTEHGVPWPDLCSRPALARTLEHVRVIIAVSAAAARGLAAYCGVRGEIRVIRHIVPDPWPGDGIPRQARPGGVTVTCVAMLRPPKGHAVLLAAAARTLEEHPGTRLVLVGDGPLRAALERQATGLGIGDRVVFVGAVDHSRVEEILVASDIFVLPSLCEPLGIAVIEAMALGLPVIATRAGGIPDLIDDRGTGLLVRPGDADSLAQALCEMIETPDLRVRLGGAARRRYEGGEFTARAVGDATLSAYGRAIEAFRQRLTVVCDDVSG